MTKIDPRWGLNYEIEKLEELSNDLKPHIKKMFEVDYLLPPEDKYVLRDLLMDVNGYVKMLREDYEKLEKALAVPLWKRLLRR